MGEEAGPRGVGYLEDLKDSRDAFLRGLTFVAGGLALVMAATLVGYAPGKAAQIGAGVLGVTGITVIVLGVILYILPPLLPSR